MVFLPHLVDLLSTTTVGTIMKETIPAKGEVKIAALGTLMQHGDSYPAENQKP